LGVEAEVPLGDVGQGEGAGTLLRRPLGRARPVRPGPQRLGDRLAHRPGHVGQGEPGRSVAAQHGQGQQRHQPGPGLGAAGPVHGTFHPAAPLRTVTYRLGILAPAASAMTRTWTSLAFTLRCWRGRTLSAATPWRAANPAGGTSGAGGAGLARTGDAAVWRAVVASPVGVRAARPAGRKATA